MKRRFFLLLVACSLLAASGAIAWPFGGLPQCDAYPSCDDGCLVPASEKCAQVAVDAVNNGDAALCTAGSSIGVCVPPA